MHFYVPCVVAVFEAAAIFEHRLGNAALKKRPFKTEGHLLRYYAASFFIVSPEGEKLTTRLLSIWVCKSNFSHEKAMVFCEQANKTRGDGVRGKCPIFHSKGYSMRDNMALVHLVISWSFSLFSTGMEPLWLKRQLAEMRIWLLNCLYDS